MRDILRASHSPAKGFLVARNAANCEVCKIGDGRHGGFHYCARMFPAWIFAFVSGVLLALCYVPVGWSDLCWVALVPLICAAWLLRPSPRWNGLRLGALGFLFGAAYFGGSLFWLTTLTAPGWIVLSLYLSIYPALWMVFIGTVARPSGEDRSGRPVWLSSLHNLRFCALGAAAWVALEWLRGVVFPQFPWNNVGIALSEKTALIQIADLTGVGGISFLVVMANLMLVATVKRLVLELRRGVRRPHYDFAITVALIALAWTYGIRQMFAPPPASVEFSFASVQANIPQNVRNDLTFESDVMARYAQYTETAMAMKPDLLLWPESSTPRPLFNDQGTWDIVRGLAERHEGDFLLGTVHFSEQGDYNSVAFLSDHAKEAQMYHKNHLVPFGEYVPFRSAFPLFAWVVGDLVPDDFDPGPYPVVFEMSTRPVKIGPLICFEDVLGDLARQFALRGAQVFAVVTNDGWFLKSAGPRQHLAHAVFRCAENKLPMLRSANTGITCVVDRCGRVGQTLQSESGDTFIEGVLIGKVSAPLHPVPTFYARNGEVFSIACLIISSLAAAVFLIRLWKIKNSACPSPSETKALER
ncbi:MAG: apolipoprotein N-acyltransferase [Terrimicrobiaceae bacterium]